jgi:ADP-ribose pyrophosphatase
MCSSSSKAPNTEEMVAMRVKVEEQHREYDGIFKLDKAVLRHEKFNGQMSDRVTRIVFERGDSVAVLLYHPERDSVVLVEQFRFPAYVREGDDGRLLEIVAGTVGSSRSPESVARAELVEEAGYAVKELKHLTTFYPSPGACSERIYLYLGSLSSAARVGPGGGAVETNEDIRVHEVLLDEALRLVREGVIRDAKTIISLQYLAIRRGKSGAQPFATASE